MSEPLPPGSPPVGPDPVSADPVSADAIDAGPVDAAPDTTDGIEADPADRDITASVRAVEADADPDSVRRVSACAAPGPPGGYAPAEQWVLVPVLPDGRIVLERPIAPPTPIAAEDATAPEAERADATADTVAADTVAADDVTAGDATQSAPQRATAKPATAAGRWRLPALPPLDDPEADRAEWIGPMLAARFDLQLNGQPEAVGERLPARLRHPRHGGQVLGWRRAIRIPVTGVPRPDPLAADVAALPPDEAREALDGDGERLLLDAAIHARDLPRAT